MSELTHAPVPAEELDVMMARVEALCPQAAAWVDRQLEVQGDVECNAGIVNLIEQAEGLDVDVLKDADLPSLFMTPEERLAAIRERIAARIPEYQGESGGRELQLQLIEDENDLAAHPEWYTEYQDRADIADRASGADEQGRVLDEYGDPMDGTWAWVMDEETGYLLLFPATEAILQYPDGRTEVLTLEEGVPRWEEARARGEDVVLARTHHTTPVAGMPVTGAGLMTLQDGWIVDITDESGHYQPTASNQYEAMEPMAEQGFSFQRPVSADDSPDGEAGYRDAKVHLTGAGTGTGGRPTGKAEWIHALGTENPYVPTDDLTLSAQQFQQTEGNEVQARLKAGLNAEFRATQADDLRRQARAVREPVWSSGPDAEAATSTSNCIQYRAAPAADPADTVINYYVAATAAAPANSLSVDYVFDEQRGLFRQQDTGNYYSETGQLVYQWDPEQGRYFDHTTQTWM